MKLAKVILKLVIMQIEASFGTTFVYIDQSVLTRIPKIIFELSVNVTDTARFRAAMGANGRSAIF